MDPKVDSPVVEELDDAKDWLIVEEKKEEDFRPEIKLKDIALNESKEDDDSD